MNKLIKVPTGLSYSQSRKWLESQGEEGRIQSEQIRLKANEASRKSKSKSRGSTSRDYKSILVEKIERTEEGIGALQLVLQLLKDELKELD